MVKFWITTKVGNVYICSHELTPSVFNPYDVSANCYFIYNRMLLICFSECCQQLYFACISCVFPICTFFSFCNSSLLLYILRMYKWDPLYISPCNMGACNEDLHRNSHYRNSHYKDKTVLRPSYLYNEIHTPRKRVFICIYIYIHIAKFPSGECHKTTLMISQHWFM